jgi:hypothetical protein
MNNVKRAILMAAGAVVAAVAVAGPASASAATQTVRPIIFPVTATTHVLTQAPGNGGIWATESVRRTDTVSGGAPVPASFCGTGATRCFAYSAIVQNHGTFRAYRFALTPNQFHPGRHIRSSVTGRVDWVTSFATFFASTAPHAFFVPPVLLRAVLRRGQLAGGVLPHRDQVQHAAHQLVPGDLQRLDQVRAAALDRLVLERARQPALRRQHPRLLAARKPP